MNEEKLPRFKPEDDVEYNLQLIQVLKQRAVQVQLGWEKAEDYEEQGGYANTLMVVLLVDGSEMMWFPRVSNNTNEFLKILEDGRVHKVKRTYVEEVKRHQWVQSS